MQKSIRKIPSQYLVIFSIIFSVNIEDITCSKDIFHGSARDIEKIMSAEKDITEAVQEYVISLERRIALAKKYLEDHQDILQRNIADNSHQFEDSQALTNLQESQNDEARKLSRKETTLFNPLKVFQLIRSLASTLPNFEKELHRDHERRFLKILETARKGVVFPQQKDLDGAVEGLLRVQDAYDLDVFSFSNGNFQGLLTNSSLNAADCYIIGSYSLNSNILTRAIEWLERSYYLVSKEFDTSISYQAVRNRLHEAIVKHNSVLDSPHEKNPYVYHEKLSPNSLGHDSKRRKKLDMPTTQQYQLYMNESSFADLTNFAALCRGEQLLSPSARKTLTCWLDQRSPYTVLSPLRVELQHEKPIVVQVYDIIPTKLSKEIIKSAQKSTLSRSQVHGKNSIVQKLVSASRTSSSTWIHEPEQVLSKLSKKIYPQLESLLGLDLKSRGACETFQVSSYNTCGHYNPHLDNILSTKVSQEAEKDERDKGDRLATLMFYLSDVARGGFSAFPRLGIATKPVKGSLLIWFNSRRNGDVEPLSLHGGCPVIFGNKWIANQWIRANSQIFARKCLKQ